MAVLAVWEPRLMQPPPMVHPSPLQHQPLPPAPEPYFRSAALPLCACPPTLELR